MVRDRIELPAFSFSAWRCGHAAWYHWFVETGPVSFERFP